MSRSRAWTPSPARSFSTGYCERSATGEDGVGLQPHARRRAAIGRHRWHSPRGTARAGGQPRRAADFDQAHLGHAPRWVPARKGPDGTVWQRIEGRQWTITVRDFSPEKVPAGPGDRGRGADQRARRGAGRTVQGLHSRTKGIAMSMKWLLWKDFRHNRPIFIATLIFLFVPYVIAVWAMWREHRGMPEHFWLRCLSGGTRL